MTTEPSLTKIKLIHKVDSQEIHLQISLLEDAVKNDRLKAPTYQAGQVLAPYLIDADIYTRQYAERTQELSCEFIKLYRLVVWHETSKHFKRRKMRKTLPFSLAQGDIHFQCQTLQNASDIILGHLEENSANYNYAKRVLRSLIKRWLARHNQHELRTLEAPQTETNGWPSPIYLFERNPAAARSTAADPSDPYSHIDEPKKINPIFIGVIGSFSTLISALLIFAYPLILSKIKLTSTLGIIAKNLSSLSMATILALQILVGVIAISCFSYLIYNKFKKKNHYLALINHPQEPSIPTLRRMSLESLDHVSIHTEPDDNEDIEKNSDAESVDLNFEPHQYPLEEKKKTLCTPKPGSLIGQQVKSQAIFGIDCDFRSTISFKAPVKSPEPNPAYGLKPENNLQTSRNGVKKAEEKKNQYTEEFLQNPIGETFDVINAALRCQDQIESLNAETIHNIVMHTFTKITWNHQVAQQSLQEILKLILYPDSMLMLYQDLESHNLRYTMLLELDLDSFEEAINAYQYLDQALKNGQFSKTPTHTESISGLINKNGFFNSTKSQEKIHAAKKLLALLETKLENACKMHPKWPNDFLEKIPQLPSTLCEMFIPYLINYQVDSLGNTLLHQLAKHPQCSTIKFEEVLKKLYEYGISAKQEWRAYVTYTNQEGDDAVRVAFAGKRFDICQLLYRYSLPLNPFSRSDFLREKVAARPDEGVVSGFR